MCFFVAVSICKSGCTCPHSHFVLPCGWCIVCCFSICTPLYNITICTEYKFYIGWYSLCSIPLLFLFWFHFLSYTFSLLSLSSSHSSPVFSSSLSPLLLSSTLLSHSIILVFPPFSPISSSHLTSSPLSSSYTFPRLSSLSFPLLSLPPIPLLASLL